MSTVVDSKAPALAVPVAKPRRDIMLTELPATTEKVGVSWPKSLV